MESPVGNQWSYRLDTRLTYAVKELEKEMHISVEMYLMTLSACICQTVGFWVQPQNHPQKDQKNVISHIRKIILLRE